MRSEEAREVETTKIVVANSRYFYIYIYSTDNHIHTYTYTFTYECLTSTQSRAVASHRTIRLIRRHREEAIVFICRPPGADHGCTLLLLGALRRLVLGVGDEGVCVIRGARIQATLYPIVIGDGGDGGLCCVGIILLI